MDVNNVLEHSIDPEGRFAFGPALMKSSGLSGVLATAQNESGNGAIPSPLVRESLPPNKVLTLVAWVSAYSVAHSGQ